MVKLLQTLFKRKLCPEHHQESRHRKDKGKTDSHVQTEPGFSSLKGGQEPSARVELGRIVTLCQTNCSDEIKVRIKHEDSESLIILML